MASLWENSVIRPLEHLSNETAMEQPEDERPINVVPFTRPAAE
jgi:hypothetical protein